MDLLTPSDPEAARRAVSLFVQGFTCAQAVLAAFADRFGLDEVAALKLGTPFGGGMARTGGMCGAVTGALMVIGMAHGRTTIEDVQAKETTYLATKAFWDRFGALHGSTTCRELLQVDIGTEEGAKRAGDAGLFRERCPLFVRDAARLLDETLGRS